MSDHSLLAISGSIVAAGVSISWLVMHGTLLFGLSRPRSLRSEDRIVWRCSRKQDAASKRS